MTSPDLSKMIDELHKLTEKFRMEKQLAKQFDGCIVHIIEMNDERIEFSIYRPV